MNPQLKASAGLLGVSKTIKNWISTINELTIMVPAIKM